MILLGAMENAGARKLFSVAERREYLSSLQCRFLSLELISMRGILSRLLLRSRWRAGC